MTAKKDLKRRIRDRQARTGEAYTTARRHVVASPPDRTPIEVDEMTDYTAAAAVFGLRCKILMSGALVAAVDPARTLVALREALLATHHDPATDVLRGIALHNLLAPIPPRSEDARYRNFVGRLLAGVGGASADGRLLGFHVGGVPVVCSAWRHEPTLVLMTLDDSILSTLSRLGLRARQP